MSPSQVGNGGSVGTTRQDTKIKDASHLLAFVTFSTVPPSLGLLLRIPNHLRGEPPGFQLGSGSEQTLKSSRVPCSSRKTQRPRRPGQGCTSSPYLPQQLTLPFLQGLLVPRSHGFDLRLYHLGLHLHLFCHRLGLLDAQLENQEQAHGVRRTSAAPCRSETRKAHSLGPGTTWPASLERKQARRERVPLSDMEPREVRASAGFPRFWETAPTQRTSGPLRATLTPGAQGSGAPAQNREGGSDVKCATPHRLSGLTGHQGRPRRPAQPSGEGVGELQASRCCQSISSSAHSSQHQPQVTQGTVCSARETVRALWSSQLARPSPHHRVPHPGPAALVKQPV